MADNALTRVISTELGGIQPDRLIDVYLTRFESPQTVRSYRADLIDFFGSNEVDIVLVQGVNFVHVNQYIASLESLGRKA